MSEQSDRQSRGAEQGEPAAPANRSAGSEASRQVPAPPQRAVVLRYGRMGHLGVFRHDLERPPAPGTTVVVRTHRGAELGRVLVNVGEALPCGIRPEELDRYVRASGPEYPFSREGKVLRVATAQDLNDQQHLDHSSQEEAAFCREQIRQLGLKMRLIAVEHLLGGERIVFYFTAEHRVDFRALVKRLAGQYHTRIEMRQVGARDEARLVADYERCGRRCCCQEYLKFLKPVSMRMAKMQKATLDPTKISGRCGRLMCCLRYEDQTYEELQSKLPRKNTWVRTDEGVVGKVVDMQILTQLVRLQLPDGSVAVVSNESIVERDLPGPEARQPEPARPKRSGAAAPQPAPPPPPAAEAEPEAPAEPAAEAPAEEAPSEQPCGKDRSPRRKKRRRSRRKSKRRHPGALSVGASVQVRPGPGAGSGAGAKPGRKKRRGRRNGRSGPAQGNSSHRQ